MAYQALYRVWRPQRFEDLVGQEHVTQTLTNALQERALSHAYLFHGSRGTGKTSAAKILAKAVNCEQKDSPEPCNQCESCMKIIEGSLMDVIEIDAASNRGVDEIRDLRENVKYAPTEVEYKVYIIDEVHMLTTEAFNALLKTLEEPPPHVIFILATTEPHKLPPTILSRCQRFSFHRLPFEKIMERLRLIVQSEGVSYSEKSLYTIARTADGGMRDALSLLDQVLAFGGEQITEETVLSITGSVSQQTIRSLMAAIAERDIPAVLEKMESLVLEGVETEKVLQDMLHNCRDLLLTHTAPELIGADEEMKQLAHRFTTQQLNQMIDRLILSEQQIKWAAHGRILLEVTLVRLCMVENQATEATSDLEKQIAELRKMVNQLSENRSAEKVVPTKPIQAESPTKTLGGYALSLPRLGSTKLLTQVKRAWPTILEQIKKERITVHAWLVNGEPVMVTEEKIILAFRSKIHRETTDRAANRTVIEEIVHQVLDRPFTIQTCMIEEWQKANQDETSATVEAEIDVFEKAVEVFGEELVQVKSEKN